jgi:hypothetical protein
MLPIRASVLYISILLAVATPASAQSTAPAPATAAAVPDTLTEIRLKDGSVLVGGVDSSTVTQVVLVTRSGTRMTIPRSEILSTRRVALQANGEAWAEDANPTRLFFSPTGRSLPKGEGYVSAYFFFLPFVAYGVTDWLTLAGGTPILPGAFGEIFYVAPKVRLLERGKTSVSAGALSFLATRAVDKGSAGILYGAGTYGSRDNAITVGAGWFYAETDGYANTSDEPVLMIGAERRISRRVKLVTENWLSIDPGVNGLISGGFRFLGERLSADLGFAGVMGEGCCVPLINFSWSFGGASAR